MHRRSDRMEASPLSWRRAAWVRAAVQRGLLATAVVSLSWVAATELATQTGPQKRALIVGIGKYPEPDIYGYSNINADNDPPLIELALRSQGFLPDDIKVLTNERATKRGILDAFRTHLLERAGPGDVIVFHYSGHGHQITDDNGDELDGYDEVLVPYGAPNHQALDPADGYAGERHLRDDTLNDLLEELRAKIGPDGHVLVTIDACFSGSATRGPYELPVRGVAEPLGPPAAARGTSGDMFESAPRASRGGSGSDLAPLVVISATDHNELDHEVWGPDRTPVGPLSLALSRTLPDVRAGMTYAAWFEVIRLTMATLVPSQTPQIEGAVDAEVLNGRVTQQKRFFRVRDVLGDTLAVIEGGTLVGIQPGARVAFYALDAGPDDPPMVGGIVDYADEVSADVLLPFSVGDEVRASRAFVTEYAYGTLEVRVAVDVLPDPAQRSLLTDALGQVPNLTLVNERPDVVVTAAGFPGNGVYLKTAVDESTIAGPFDVTVEVDRQALVERLGAYARIRFLTQVAMRDPNIDVRLEIVPATHQITSRGCVASDTTQYGARKTAGGWEFRKDDGYLLRLRNVGPEAAYVAVLELSATGIAQLFPNAAFRVSDNLLAPGTTFLVQDLCFSADEPLGDYVLKLFATRDRIDFGPVVESRGLSRSGERLSYFEQLVADAYRGTRSGVTGRAQGTGTTHATTVTVVPQ